MPLEVPQATLQTFIIDPWLRDDDATLQTFITDSWLRDDDATLQTFLNDARLRDDAIAGGWLAVLHAHDNLGPWNSARDSMSGIEKILASISGVELATLLGVVVVFEAWERLSPARLIDRNADIRTDSLSFGLSIFFNRLSTIFWGAVVLVLPALFVPSLESSAAKVALAVVAADFCIYWIHRAQHASDLLWRTHAWHHSMERLYWFSGFRASFMHSLLYNMPQALIPLLVFKLTPLETAAGYSIAIFIQFWEHTNISVNIGPLRWIFITPDYHRAHHTSYGRRGKNLAPTLSIWDRLFGTYLDPDSVPSDAPLGLGEKFSKKDMARMMAGV